MRKGSTRSTYAMRPTGGDSDGISQKPSKRLKKWSSAGETYPSICSKRVKLPKKHFDGCGTVNHSSVPRKLRSAMKNRHDESVSPSIRNGTCSPEMQSKDSNKKLKVDRDERQHPTMSESITGKTTEDEKDAMAALLSMAGIVPGNDTADEINLKIGNLEAEASSLQEKYDLKTAGEAATASKSKDLVQKQVQIHDLDEVTNTLDDSEDFTDGKKLQKRCALHVYICGIIKDLQVTEGKLVNSHKEPKQRDYADVKTNIIPKTITNGSAGRVGVSSHLVAKNHAGIQVTHHFDAASALPYFGSPLYDPSQWSRPVFPKNQMWIHPYVSGARYQNGGREMMPHLSSSYTATSGSKYVQPSLVDVLGSKDARSMAHQTHYNMPFGNHSSGYEENKGSLFVDRSLRLNLTL